MSTPRIAIIVDHPQRDLAGLVLLAHALCQRGATCHIVPLNLQEEEIWALAPDFVLLNYVRRGNDDFARRLVQAGIGFAVLDTEGGVWDAPASYSSMLWADIDLLQRVSCVCLWGPRLAEHVIREGLFTTHQVVVTGCPRFDFYHPAWRSVVADGGPHEAPRILVNTNFSFANPRFSTLEKNIIQLRDEIGWSHERVMEKAETEQRAVEEMVRIARALASDFPAARVVLRPHPFEDPAIYRTGLCDLPNAEINVDGPVQPQIFRAAVVIQRGCSTAIESAMAQTPTLSPAWFSVAGLAPTVEAVSDPCATYAVLREKVEAVLAGSYTPSAGLREAAACVIGDWFCAIDGRAHERAAAALAPCLPTTRTVDDALCRRYLYGVDGRSRAGSLERLSRRARYRLRLSPDWSFRQFRSVPRLAFADSHKHFSADHVAAIVERLRRAPGMAGTSPRPVTVGLARERGELRHGYHGYAVTLRCA